MEKKKLDLMKAKSLSALILELNKLGIGKEDIVNIFKDTDAYYVAIFYY